MEEMNRPVPPRLRQAAMVGVWAFSLVATPIAAGLDRLVHFGYILAYKAAGPR